jgi:hypothetical protein
VERSLFLASEDIRAESFGALIRPIVSLIRAGIARSSQISQAEKVSPPLAARLVADGVWTTEEGLAHIEITSGLQTIWSLGWLQPWVSPHERQVIEDKIFRQIASGLILEDSSLLAVAPYASATLRARLVTYGESISGDPHARILAHVAPHEPLRRDEWLNRFSARRWKNSREKRGAYLQLLRANLLPPSTTPAELLAMALSEPDGSTREFLVHIAPLVPEESTDALFEIVVGHADHLLLEIVDRHPEGLSSGLLQKLRGCVANVRDPLVAKWLEGVTSSILQPSQQRAALQQSVDCLKQMAASEWRVPLAIMAISKQVDGEEREALHIAAWNKAAEGGLHRLGAARFAQLCRPLSEAGVAHASTLIAGAPAQTRMQCLPHLIGAAASTQVEALVEVLIATSRELGTYADLLPCLDKITGEQVERLLAASVALAPICVSFANEPTAGRASTPPPVASPYQKLREQRISEVHAKMRERMRAIDAMRMEDVRACIADTLGNASLHTREIFVATIESLRPALERCLVADELRDLEADANRTLALYATA